MQTVDLQVTFRERFDDKRFAGLTTDDPEKHLTLTGRDVEKIWTPDTFFRNSMEEEIMGGLQPNTYARIYGTGKVQTSRRMKIKLFCPELGALLERNGNASCPLDVASCKF